jgi:uncharacterized protein (TIGR02001 family)
MVGPVLRNLVVGASLATLGLAQSALAADLAAPKTLPAEAATPSQPIDFVYGVRLQSDYNFRGITQSNHDPSTQAYFETQLFDNFLYFGMAAYKVDLPTRPPIEFDITGGIRPKWGPLAFDLGFIYYNYPHERRLVDEATNTFFSLNNTDFIEAAFKVSYTVNDQLTLGANVFYAPDYLGTGSEGTYASGTAKYTLPEGLFGVMPAGFALSGEFGHYSFGTTSPQLGSVRLPDYFYGNVGVSYTYKAATLDVRYHDTDLNKRECFTLTGDPGSIARGSGASNWCGSAVIATLSFDITASQLPGVLDFVSVAPPK